MDINKKQIQSRVIKLASTLPPTPTEDKNRELVDFGKNNDYDDYLIKLSTVSGLHTAILDKKVSSLMGDKITYNGQESKKTDDFISKCNQNETLYEVMAKCAWDYEILGGFYLQIVWAKDKKSIAEIYHVPYQTVRATKKDEKGNINKFYIKKSWVKDNNTRNATEIEAFTGKFSTKPQLLRCMKYSPSNQYYSYPSYVGATQDVDTLFQIVNFHNNAIKNNFSAGMIMAFRGPVPTDEEMDDIVKNVTKKYGGSDNAGVPIILFLDGDQQEPKIEQLATSDLDKLFNTLSDTAKENVTLAHSIPRCVAGLETKSTLGNSKEIVEANMMFQNDYVKKSQNFVLSNFNKITEINGMEELIIINQNPSIMLYSENLMSAVLTKEEIRTLFGFENIKNTDTQQPL